MKLLPDTIITDYALNKAMITPFVPSLVRQNHKGKAISYGLSSYGYDLRLAPVEFKVFRHIPGEILDPKNFNPEFLENVSLRTDDNGAYFVLPAHSYGLGVTMERLSIPDNITCLFIGKSTYARCGLIANLTPGEAGWQGYLTLEITNTSDSDARIYANEGIVQALFFESEPCSTSYQSRSGKYQNQDHQITLAKV